MHVVEGEAHGTELTAEFDSAELEAIARVVQQSIPFNTLSPGMLAYAVGQIEICYHRQGESFNRNTPDKGLRLLRSGAIELRDGNNKLLDRLGESESFHIHGLNVDQNTVRAVAIEDTLIYLLPDNAYQALRGQDREFDRFFSGQRSRRLRRAARYEPNPNAMTRPVSSVMTRELVCVAPSDSVQQVAELMSRHRVSSAFVLHQADSRCINSKPNTATPSGTEVPWGIVTDRDIRQRFVAAGLPRSTAVVDIMTPDPVAVPANATLFEATLLMTQRRFHHLPVVENNELQGIVTISDLSLARQDDPVYLVQHVSRQKTVQGLKELLAGMPNLMVQWVQSEIPAREVSRILTAISDAVTVRLIELAILELGPAPGPFCWAGFGSQGRGEQMLGADQDNGLILSDEVLPEHLPWFEAMAEYVCDGLHACGYWYCPGDIMASNTKWRQPLAAWLDYAKSWTRTPTPEAVMRVTIFFDLRSIYGDSILVETLRRTMLQVASRNTIFLAALAANALQASAPLGIFRRFVVERNGDHRDTVDLKKRGVLPITDIARIHALAAGIEEVNTDQRLLALRHSKALTINDARNLVDALNVLQRLRMNSQVEQVLRGEQPDNFVDPRDLPKLAREQLRDAFSIIDEAQTALKLRYRAGLG